MLEIHNMMNIISKKKKKAQFGFFLNKNDKMSNF